jgi:hypothetical protein
VAGDLYQTASTSNICQGDIVVLAPHVYLAPPLTKLDPHGDSLFRAEAEPFTRFDDEHGERVVAHCKRRLALVLTYDCELDKRGRRWLICPLLPLSVLPGAAQGSVRKNRVLAALFLPAYRDKLPDSYADFNQITTVEPDIIRAATRELSLSDLGRVALYNQFIRWFTRWSIHEIDCPECNTTFDPMLSLPVRPADGGPSVG